MIRHYFHGSVWDRLKQVREQSSDGQYLWDLVHDPDQNENVAEANRDQADRLAGALRKHLTAIGAPQEQFARLRL